MNCMHNDSDCQFVDFQKLFHNFIQLSKNYRPFSNEGCLLLKVVNIYSMSCVPYNEEKRDLKIYVFSRFMSDNSTFNKKIQIKRKTLVFSILKLAILFILYIQLYGYINRKWSVNLRCMCMSNMKLACTINNFSQLLHFGFTCIKQLFIYNKVLFNILTLWSFDTLR